MGFDRYFGFNTTQKKTLENLLADAGLDTEQADAVEAVAALPTTDPGSGGVWNDGGVLKVTIA